MEPQRHSPFISSHGGAVPSKKERAKRGTSFIRSAVVGTRAVRPCASSVSPARNRVSTHGAAIFLHDAAGQVSGSALRARAELGRPATLHTLALTGEVLRDAEIERNQSHRKIRRSAALAKL